MSKTIQEISSASGNRKIDLRILLLALGAFALATDALVIVGMLPVIAHETQVTESLAGQLVTLFSLTYGLGAPFLAALSGRWPGHKVLVVALAMFCLANIGSALSPNFAILLLTRILAGCFAALYTPLAYTVGVSLAPPEKRGQALAFILSGSTVASVLGGPFGTWVGEHWGWRVAFGLVALFAGLACAVLWLCGLPKMEATPGLPLKNSLRSTNSAAPIAGPAPAALGCLGFYVVYTYIAPLLQQNLHITDVSGMFIVCGAGTALGIWLGGSVVDRFGATLPLIIGLVALGIIEASLTITNGPFILTLAALFLWGSSMSGVFISQQHRLLSLAAKHTNVIMALNSSLIYLGIAGGAALGGFALRYITLAELGWVGAGCTFLALLLLFLNIWLSTKSRAITEKALVNQT